MKQFLHALFHTIFWGWNLAFLAIVYLGILPLIGVFLIPGVINGEIESEFLITFFGLIACPTICTFIGWRLFKNQPLNLIRLFYGVEAPLFLLLCLRLFVLRELTAASYFFIATVLVSIVAFFAELIYGYRENNRALAYLQMAAHSLMLLLGLYTATLIFFYAVPAAAAFLVWFFSFEWLKILGVLILSIPTMLGWGLIYIFLFILSCSIFIAMPSSLASLYIYSAQKIFRQFSKQYGRSLATVITLGVITTSMVLFLYLARQPQIEAFALLNNNPQTDKERQELIAKSDIIRQGLTNAYLASYRYISPQEKSNQIRGMYQSIFALPDATAQGLQDTFNLLMSPFLYQGSYSDKEKSASLYAGFFDIPLEKAERISIQHALKSTAILDDAKAGLLNIDQKKVWLKEQQVTVNEQGNQAEIELHEVYENQTFEVEEIFYYFSLPETAVITGLWLGDTDNIANRYTFKVATRGAAQKVYNSQVQRSRPIDPALLEQVGLKQYRLRAFPVPPKLGSWETNQTERPTQMHLWLTYKVMQQDGKWLLPKLEEKRNIFFTQQTLRIRNGKEIKITGDEWLETSLNATVAQPQLQQVNLINGYSVTATPLTQKDYLLPQGKHFAIILDTSRSMQEHTQELKTTFQWLQKQLLTNNQADLYVTNSQGMSPKRLEDLTKFNPDKKVFYGNLDLKEMLRQFASLQDKKIYDAIAIITDRGNYELSSDSNNVPKISPPLWVVHLGNLAPAYDDVSLKLIDGVETEISEVFKKIATVEAKGKSTVTVADGYGWFLTKETKATNADFAPFGARVLVRGLSKKIESEQLAELDAIHAIAVNYKIVTPYSSMIVLVNDEQRKALQEAEKDSDRFSREIEDGIENLDNPNNPLNTEAIPEPTTIGGIILGAIFLFASKKIVDRRAKI